MSAGWRWQVSRSLQRIKKAVDIGCVHRLFQVGSCEISAVARQSLITIARKKLVVQSESLPIDLLENYIRRFQRPSAWTWRSELTRSSEVEIVGR